MRTLLLFLAVVSAGCAVSLDVPDEVEVSCRDDADCVDGWVCSPSGLCVEELSTSFLALLAAAAIDSNQVRLIFDQPIVGSVARQREHYAITPVLAVLDAYRDADEAAVVLRTDDQVFGSSYTVTVDGLVGRGGTFIDPAAASAVFIGFGTPSDTTAPDTLAPADDALVIGLSQVLVWSARNGATQYTVKVAHDPTCTAPILTQTLSAEATSTQVTLSSTGVYHWCVSSNLSGSASGHGVFHVTDSAVYVHCDTASCAPDATEIGSPDAPMHSVQRAVALAQQLGLSTVRIAGRSAGASYDEVVQIAGTGVDLVGGYDASFAIVDTTAHPTNIRFASSALILNGVSTPMLVTGIGFIADTTYAPNAVVVSNAELVTFRDVRMHAEGAGDATGIRIAGTEEVTLERVTITTSGANHAIAVASIRTRQLRLVDSMLLPGNGLGLSATSRGIWADGGALEVSGSSVVTGTSTSQTVALETSGNIAISDSFIVAREATLALAARISGGIVERSRIYANAGFIGTGIYAEGHPVVLRDNVVVAAGANGSTCGIELSDVNGITRACGDGAATKLVGNTVYSTGYGIELHAGSPVISNNLIRADGTCMLENPVVSYDTADPLSFQNNALLTCPTAYGEERGTPGQIPSTFQALTDAAAVNGLAGGACREEAASIVRYSGNVSGSVTNSALFTDLDGADNLFFDTADNAVFEAFDNDFSLRLDSDALGIRGGGKPATGSDCGDGGVACGGAGVDLRGATRTVPWSIGAYEKD